MAIKNALKKKKNKSGQAIPPIPGYESFNKAACARAIGISRPYVSRIMRGLDNNPVVLRKIKAWILSINNLAALICILLFR